MEYLGFLLDVPPLGAPVTRQGVGCRLLLARTASLPEPGLWWGGAILLLLGVAFWAWTTYRKRRHQHPNSLPHEAALPVQPALVSPPLADSIPLTDQTTQYIALLSVKDSREAAANELVRLGEAALPQLRHTLAQETEERRLLRLAQVSARIDAPAARQMLVEVAQMANLPARAAALRALNRLPAVPTESPQFQHLMEEELRLAQHLLHGMATANAELRVALRYEVRQCQQRLFGLLLQVYERPAMLDAQRGAAHATAPREAAALELLEKLIPRPLYRGVRALLDIGELHEQVPTIDSLLGAPVPAEPIQTMIVRRGMAAFSAWTIGLALQQWHPQPATVAYLFPHLQSTNPLIQESAADVLLQLPVHRPAAYDHFLTLYSAIIPLLMTSPATTSCVSAQERVRMLKGTALFAETPENVLGTILPIMKEVAFEPEQEIFVKGNLGTSLFIVCDGEVGIFDGSQQLATFHKGDFFGELALLDAEPRSATAVARGHVVTFRLDQEDFYDVMEERNEVLRGILKVLCQRLRRQNEMAQVAE